MKNEPRISFALQEAQVMTAFVMYQLLGILSKEEPFTQVELESRFQNVHEKELVAPVLEGLSSADAVIRIRDLWIITPPGRARYMEMKAEMKEQ